MAKIAMIGAGSQVFCKTLTSDILATDVLKDSEIRLMSRTLPKLERMEAFIKRMVKENGLSAEVWSTLDRRATNSKTNAVANRKIGCAFAGQFLCVARYSLGQTPAVVL